MYYRKLWMCTFAFEKKDKCLIHRKVGYVYLVISGKKKPVMI